LLTRLYFTKEPICKIKGIDYFPVACAADALPSLPFDGCRIIDFRSKGNVPASGMPVCRPAEASRGASPLSLTRRKS